MSVDPLLFNSESLLQIYGKGVSKNKIKQINYNNMYLNKKELKKLRSGLSSAAKNVITYCMFNMSTKECEFETMMIELDYYDETCKSEIAKDKKTFYGAINELVEAKFMMKLKPKLYLVDHGYISYLTQLQVDRLKAERYQNFQIVKGDTSALNLKLPTKN